jgi:hypothetical protein
MVTFIASYLFDKPTHLNDLYNRKEDSTHQFWTLSYVPGERLAKQPVNDFKVVGKGSAPRS